MQPIYHHWFQNNYKANVWGSSILRADDEQKYNNLHLGYKENQWETERHVILLSQSKVETIFVNTTLVKRL